MNADGVHAVETLAPGLKNLVTKRFRRMDAAVRHALGWSSEQGVRFLTAVTLASAQCVDSSITEDDLRGSLRRARVPYSVVELLGDPGRFNRSEFRQAVYQEVARDFLHCRSGELACVQRAIRQTLVDWLVTDDPKQTPPIDLLPEAERLDALVMARHSLSPDATEPEPVRIGWCRAMHRLALIYRDQFAWHQAWEVVEAWAQAAPDGWPLDWLAFIPQAELCRILRSGAEYRLAAQIMRPIAETLGRSVDTDTERTTLRDLSVALDELGDSELREGRREAALAAFRRGLEISERIVTHFGETTESLSDVVVSRFKLAQAEPEQAREHLTLARDRMQTLIDRNWATADQRQWLEIINTAQAELGCESE